jgi:ribosomal protein L7/L12
MRPAEGSSEASSAFLTGTFPETVSHIYKRLESAMRLDRSELSKAVQTALSMGAVAAVGVAGTAFAQNATTQNDQNQPQTLQTIVVTGSHIRRVDLETSNPVVAVTSQQIQQTGKLTLGDVIQQLRVITGGI